MTERENAISALVEFSEALQGLISTYESHVAAILRGTVPDGLSMDECHDIRLVRRLAMELEDEASSIARDLD